MSFSSYSKIVLLCMLFLCSSCREQGIKVGLLVANGNRQTPEMTAIAHLLQGEDSVSYEFVPIDKLDDLYRYDVLWYHREDTATITNQEKGMGKQLMHYVSEGGKLFLSMEATRLLNTWQVEPEPIQATTFQAKDEGFGRKVGFHAFREHPLFDKLFGGAYTWHGKADNDCRVLGFFGDKKPLADSVKVIGILWEYIFYHPKDKVLWETSVGKGKILAAGGFLYYSRENFHTGILKQFTRNCLNYLSGQHSTSRSFYWEELSTEVVEEDISATIPVKKVASAEWNIATSEVSLVWEATQTTVDLPSKRHVLVAKEQSGIEEIWTHPFMSVRDYRILLDIEGVDTLVSLSTCRATIELRPNAIIRNYLVEGIELKEVLTSQIERPVTIAHYEWNTSRLKRVITECKCNLRFMWPYDENALGNICYGWSASMNAWVVRDANKEFISVVGCNAKGTPLLAGRYDGFQYTEKQPQGVSTDKLQTALSVAYDVVGTRSMDVCFAAGVEGTDNVFRDYVEAMEAPSAVFATSKEYYDTYTSSHLTLHTPDTLFNEGYRWALLSSMQFIVKTPGIGTSLMAGYSSSRRGWGGGHKVSGRPGYAWYFGRDAVWASFAFMDMGDFETVREVLETLIRFQQVDGKIYHELTTSGSVHFDASDATPLFVNLMARYLRASGDITFVKQHADAVNLAMDYCYSTDTDGDRLIEITNVGHGWLEGGKLYGSHTEFYLVGVWNAALNDAAYLAQIVNDPVRQAKYSADAEAVHTIINRDFWNEKGYYNYGKRKDGSFTDENIVLTSVPVYMGVTDRTHSLQMLKGYSSGKYSSDWGVRMIDESHSIFNPTSYHFGSVWPLFTGWTALAEYRMGRYNQGFSHIIANLQNYKGISHGRVPEVLNGLVYKPSGVTLHQCWSSTMVLQPTIEGMLGFEPDALNNRFILAPRLPFNWNTFSADNLRMGGVRASFRMEKETGKVVYTLAADKVVSIVFNPSFALGTRIDKVIINGKESSFKTLADEEYVTLLLPLNIQKQAIVTIIYKEGMSALPTFTLPQKEEKSKGIHVLTQEYKNNTLEILVEGRSGSTISLDLYCPNGYENIQGVARVASLDDRRYRLDIRFDLTKETYITKKIKITGK